jgi:hypothetical protein
VQAYTAWAAARGEGEAPPPAIMRAYQKALATATALAPQEAALVAATAQGKDAALAAHLTYLQFVEVCTGTFGVLVDCGLQNL